MSDVPEQVGWVHSVMVNGKTGNMVDEHLRLQIAFDRKEKCYPSGG